MGSYIFQVILFQLAFLLVYEFLLKKETFFNYNRVYLLVTPVLAFLLPLFNIEMLTGLVPQESVTSISRFWLPEVYIGDTAQNIQQLPELVLTEKNQSFNWLAIIYSIGILISLGIIGKKLFDLRKLFKFNVVSEVKSFRIIEIPSSNVACTFNKTIFLGADLSKSERQQIIAHELIHVQQKHSYDLVFFEVLKILFWFNPLIYIYQNRIAALHEFIADSNVVKTIEKRSYYEQLLNTAFNTQNISFINQFFNHSLIKKRIVMLQKSKSKTRAKLKYFVLVPLIMLMLTYTSTSAQNSDFEINLSSYSDSDQLLIEEYRSELQMMKSKNAEIYEIADVFMTELDKHIMTKEAFYRFKVYLEFTFMEMNSNKDKSMYQGFERFKNQNYEDYVAFRKTQPMVEAKDVQDSQELSEVPFAVVDQIPIFPGCENVGGEGTMKDCVSQKIQEHVIKNFNTNLGKELGFYGVNRVIVQFKIDKNGEITTVRARAPHQELETEAIRVINTLPKMIPGKQRGKAVGVMYSLPIVFQVQKTEEVDEKN